MSVDVYFLHTAGTGGHRAQSCVPKDHRARVDAQHEHSTTRTVHAPFHSKGSSSAVLPTRQL